MRKFLYSILAAGAVMLAAAGCSDSNEVDNPNDPENPGNTPANPSVTVYTADCAGELTAAEWANVKKWSAEEWAAVKWTATSTIDLVRYETTEGDFDSGVYSQIIKVVRKDYDYSRAILTDPESVEWFDRSSESEVTTGLEEGAVFVITADKSKLNPDGETKADVTLLTDDGTELTKLTFRVEPATDIVTIAAEATGPWTADVTLTHLGTAKIFVFGIVPAKDDAARTAFIEAAMESIRTTSDGGNEYYTYGIGWAPADFEITGKTYTTGELLMAREAAALRPSTDYKALVFACNLDEPSEDGMNSEFDFAGAPAYYKVVEANFATPAWNGTEAGDINYETLRHTAVRADLKFTIPSTYTKVLYGYSAADVAAADWSAAEGVEYAANTGNPLEFSGKFAGNDKLNFFVAGITADGKVAYKLLPMQKGAVTFDSIESFEKFNLLTEKVQNYEIANGTATLTGVRVGVQFAEHENGENKVTAKIKEVRYIYSEKPVAYADVVANLTDEAENTTKHYKSPVDLLLTVTLSQTAPGNYAGEYYVYAMLVDEDDNYGEIVYLTTETEGNFEVLAEGGSAKALKFEWEVDETNVDYSIWKQTVKDGNVKDWLSLTFNGNFLIYSGTVESKATAANAKEVYLLHFISNDVAVSENNLRGLVNEITKIFQDYPTIHDGSDESDEIKPQGSVEWVSGAPGSLKFTEWHGTTMYMDCGSTFVAVIVDNNNNLTLKAAGWTSDGTTPTLVDLTKYFD